MRIRIIPSLLIHKGGLYKSVRFKDYKYVGDPINAVRIFNEKEVDEIAIVDIDASREGRPPNFSQVEEIVSEAFMPVAYGGGISKVEEIKKIFFLGVEKVIINSSLHGNPGLVTEAAKLFGSQSIVASIDVKKTFLNGYRVFVNNGKTEMKLSPVLFAKYVESMGVGEILLNSIDRDGTYKGYDHELISTVAASVNIPVIAAGGAGSLEDFVVAGKHGASAVSAGSMFVFKRPHQAVLISYPSQEELNNKLFKNI